MGQLPAFSMQLGDVCGYGVGGPACNCRDGDGISGAGCWGSKRLGQLWFSWPECLFGFFTGLFSCVDLGLPKILGLMI